MDNKPDDKVNDKQSLPIKISELEQAEKKDVVKKCIDLQYNCSEIINNIFYDNTSEIMTILEELKSINFLTETVLTDIDLYVSPQIITANLGRAEILQVLLSLCQIDINMTSEPKNISALAAACMTNNYEVVNILLLRHADPNLAQKNGETPLYLSIKRQASNTDMKQKRIYCFKIAYLLMEFGALIDSEIEKNTGLTLQMKICSRNEFTDSMPFENNKKLIVFLLENGANRYLKDVSGMGVFDHVKGHERCKELLPVLEETQRVYIHQKNSSRNILDKKDDKQAWCNMFNQGF